LPHYDREEYHKIRTYVLFWELSYFLEETLHSYSQKEEAVESLNRNGWSGILSGGAVDKLRICTFFPGEFIYREDEECRMFYFYLGGKSKVFKLLENGQTMLVRFYQQFQIMGDVELFLNSPAINSVQAISQVKCLGISMDAIKEEAKVNNTLLNRLGSSLARKLESSNMTSAINQNYPLETRLASYLSVIYPQVKTGYESEDLETENLEEMAQFLGCSYRHLTRTLNNLKLKGIIEKSRKGIRVLDFSRLKELSRDLYV